MIVAGKQPTHTPDKTKNKQRFYTGKSLRTQTLGERFRVALQGFMYDRILTSYI